MFDLVDVLDLFDLLDVLDVVDVLDLIDVLDLFDLIDVLDLLDVLDVLELFGVLMLMARREGMAGPPIIRGCRSDGAADHSAAAIGTGYGSAAVWSGWPTGAAVLPSTASQVVRSAALASV